MKSSGKKPLPFLRSYGAGWISGVTPEVEESLYQLGDLLGVAYQIYDDCLDMVGDEDDAGKTLPTDATKGKLTLPIFNLLECGDRNVEATLRDAIENREVVDYSAFQDNPVFAEALDKAIQVALEKTRRPAKFCGCVSPKRNIVKLWRK